MISFIRKRLGVKLFLTYLVVILVGVLILASVAQFTLPTVFERHMAGSGDGMGMMLGRSGQNQGQGVSMIQDLYDTYQQTFNEAMAWAVLAATALAILVSLVFSRSVVAPVRSMRTASHRIAEGNYSERVPVRSQDELGELASSFNQMAGKLEQVETMRRQLIGDVTHELRTPLTAIKGSMEGLMDNILPASEETFQQIHQEADRLSRLVDDLQELSRVEAGAYPLNLTLMDITPIIESTVKRLAYAYESKGVSLTTELPSRPLSVLADADRIGQVLLNLIGNALHYTSRGGTVHIQAQQQNSQVEVSVRDNGIGIPKEHLEHIFTRFYRVDKSRSRQSGGGSGIGLTIAHYLIEAHGGRIWAESDGEGTGSTFTFTLKSGVHV